MKPPAVNLAYLLVSSPSPNIFIGGLMVTDRYGLPLEFRYTEPIQPTRIQQVLYGQVLNAYVKRDVILETLLKNVEVSFKALLVVDESLLEHTSKSYGVARVTATKNPPIGTVGKRQELGPGELLLQVSAEGSPVRLKLQQAVSTTPAPNGQTTAGNASPTGESLAASSIQDDSPGRSRSDVTALLLDAGQTMDVAEPLQRIEKALDIICHETGIAKATT